MNIETGAIRDVATPLSITGDSLTADARLLIDSERQIEAGVWMSEIASGK